MSTAGEPADRQARIDGRKTRSHRTETLVDRVRRLILEDIIQMRVEPGSLLQLSELAERYRVSRTPVREALGQLEQQGLVTAVAFKGYLVRSIDPADVRDVYLVRKVVEGAAAELAATRISEEELGEMRGTRPPQQETMTLEYDAYAHDFHCRIVEAAGSARLLGVFSGIYNDVRRLQYAGVGNPRPDLIHAEHVAIVEALAQRDGALARSLMEQHIDAICTRALADWIDER